VYVIPLAVVGGLILCFVCGLGYIRLRKSKEEAESRQEISKWIAGRGSDIMIALELKDRKGMMWSEANPGHGRLSVARDSVHGLNPSNAAVLSSASAIPYGSQSNPNSSRNLNDENTEGVNPLTSTTTTTNEPQIDVIAEDGDPFVDMYTDIQSSTQAGRRSLTSVKEPINLEDDYYNTNSGLV